MKQYKDLVQHVMDNGEDSMDRTGVGTRSIFGWQSRYNLQDGFPLVTTKFTSFKTILKELVWYLRGDGNTKFLKDNGVTIWDEWADENGDLGKIYPYQWRNWEKYTITDCNNSCTSLDGKRETYYGATVHKVFIDQIAELIDGLKNNPRGRRHIVSAWNVSDLDEMALPPCHSFFQFYVSNNKLSCQLYQR